MYRASTPDLSMSDATQSQQAQAPRPRASRNLRLPGENLTLEETLRVLDVARELRERRETAEEMFRRDDLRRELREKLLRAARVSGDNVTEAELDVAIEQYFDSLHTYSDPEPGLRRFLAHCWVWRGRIMTAAAVVAGLAAAGGFWLMFT